MMDGKKRAADNGDTRGSELKRAKTDLVDSHIVWEWEDDGHVWTAFSKQFIQQFNDAFKSGISKLDIIINDLKFNIMFERMVQRNSKTFWERRIRANKEGEDGGLSGTYEYDENGKWILYDHSGQRLIYAALLFGLDSVNFSIKRKSYEIDLKKMEQLNKKSKQRGQIRLQGTEHVGVNDDVKAESKNEKVENVKERKTLRAMKNGEVCKRKPQIMETNEEEVRCITFKGKAPVDDECFAKDKYHVYYEGDIVYDAMLNQTNLKNNNNKFYLMQILQTNTNTAYAVWFRWGRVGMKGQTNLTNCGNDLNEAKEIFCKKFFDKTKNEFFDRKQFKKVAGKYDLLSMDYESTEKDEVDTKPEPKIPKKIPESKLDKKLQDLVQLLCNVKEMEDAVLEMKYDSKKAPLGKLTKAQIKAGYKALQKIEHCINNVKLGDELIKACDAFYTRIPHSYGMQRLPIIRTKQELKEKIALLEILGDIEIAMKVMNEESDSVVNPIDRHYLGFNCELKLLDHNCEEFRIINKYTQHTHAKTHNQYRMEVLDVFEINDGRQAAQFNDVGNRMLLWHGSRLTNVVGILSQGLRIAPPEAPVTGYMFGKGVYFADMSSKSANYCYPTRSRNIGITLLCDVSLGTTRDLLAADYEADEIPDGFHSTKGLGKIAPDNEQYEKLSDGVVVPCGLPAETGVNNPEGYTLNYNEYVVYDTRQIKSRYLVQLKFHFN